MHRYPQAFLSSLPKTIESFTDDQLQALAVIFDPSVAVDALDILDRGEDAVNKIIGPAGRSFFQVETDSEAATVFPSHPYCTCQTHQTRTVCPHLLAVHLSVHTGSHGTQKWNDTDFLNFLSTF